MRHIWFVTGIIALCLGIIGAVLPLMPTVVFLLVAVFAFGKSSPTLKQWILDHPKLGPPVSNWLSSGAISRKSKIWATVSIMTSFVIAWWAGSAFLVLIVLAGILGAVLTFILTRPEPDHEPAESN